jgi:hypothetical protein
MRRFHFALLALLLSLAAQPLVAATYYVGSCKAGAFSTISGYCVVERLRGLKTLARRAFWPSPTSLVPLKQTCLFVNLLSTSARSQVA